MELRYPKGDSAGRPAGDDLCRHSRDRALGQTKSEATCARACSVGLWATGTSTVSGAWSPDSISRPGTTQAFRTLRIHRMAVLPIGPTASPAEICQRTSGRLPAGLTRVLS